MDLYCLKHELYMADGGECPICKAIKEDKKRPNDLQKANETITKLRGHLQNCVNHLERAKRRTRDGGFDECIEQASRTLYETLIR